MKEMQRNSKKEKSEKTIKRNHIGVANIIPLIVWYTYYDNILITVSWEII